MERVFYSINESGAKTAHEMMSWSDYKPGSKTAEYQSCVNDVYDLAEKVAEIKPDREGDVKKLADRYSKKMADWFNREIGIGLMCPSVMISGAGNFPTRKKEKQVKAWDKNHEQYQYVQSIKHKIESILYGKEIIKSNDDRAIEKLQEKLDDLKELQEKMKAANKAIRKKNKEEGDEELRALGFSDENIAELRTPDFCGRIGFPDYALKNNNAAIKNTKARINGLKRVKEEGTKEKEYDFCKVVENTEDMRLQIFFEDKPEPEIRSILKSNGWRWAPLAGAWQRQLTTNAKYSLDRVMKQIEELKGA